LCPPTGWQQSLTTILKAAKCEVGWFISGTQVWFDRQMDRVTGSYKRWAKRWVIVIAVVGVCVGNLRATVIQPASDQNFCSTPADPTKCAEEAATLLQRTGIPLGWTTPNPEDGI
jgi:hypothetical protein